MIEINLSKIEASALWVYMDSVSADSYCESARIRYSVEVAEGFDFTLLEDMDNNIDWNNEGDKAIDIVLRGGNKDGEVIVFLSDEDIDFMKTLTL